MTDDNNILRKFDPAVPNVARIYDYLLGGRDNLPADRDAAEELIAALPDAAIAANHNREFLRRAVRTLARDSDIRQFIDIGTGLPTRGNVHEIAQRWASDARVLYVDYDAVVVEHAQALLADNPTTVAINRDLRRPDDILNHPALRALIDLNEPVALLMVAVLHFIEDAEDPYSAVDRLKEAMAPGSYLVLSHVTPDDISPDVAARVRKLYEHTSAPGVARTRAEIARFFSGLEVVPPGLVNVSSWRPGIRYPEDRGTRTLFYAGMGRKGHRGGAR